MKQQKTELLMPAGSLDKLKVAILYGADAVYMGTPDMSLRTKSAFTLEDLLEGMEFVHAHKKKAYLTLNLFSHNKDIEKLPVFIETVRRAKPDGLIIADPGIFEYVKQNAPELELHVSTQANVCSWLSVNFWEKQGASLCVLAREVSFQELKEIREKCPNIKLEAFVHGAMCMTYSGRCLLSNFMAERGANQGNCAHNCRWNYKLHLKLRDGIQKELTLTPENIDLFEFLLEEEFRPGDFMPFEEDGRGSYIMNSRDLCLLPKLNEYLELGIDSFKVEGRNKGLYYLAVVTGAYRRAIDDWYDNPEEWSYESYMKELYTVSNRGYSLAFHDGRLTNLAHSYDNSFSASQWEFAGVITSWDDDSFCILPKNRIQKGDVLEFVSPNRGNNVLLRIYEFINAQTGKITEIVHAGSQAEVRIPLSVFNYDDSNSLRENLPVSTVIRKEKILGSRQKTQVALNDASQKLELGSTTKEIYDAKKKKMLENIDENTPKHTRTPRQGADGCCGKGCNGCLIFWQDPSYQKARDLMESKKMGEKLKSNMRCVDEV